MLRSSTRKGWLEVKCSVEKCQSNYKPLSELVVGVDSAHRSYCQQQSKLNDSVTGSVNVPIKTVGEECGSRIAKPQLQSSHTGAESPSQCYPDIMQVDVFNFPPIENSPYYSQADLPEDKGAIYPPSFNMPLPLSLAQPKAASVDANYLNASGVLYYIDDAWRMTKEEVLEFILPDDESKCSQVSTKTTNCDDPAKHTTHKCSLQNI